jgi:hypothetical protein
MYEPQQPDDIDINKIGSKNEEIQSQNIVERAQAENLSVKNVVSRERQLQGLFRKLIIFGLGLGVVVAVGVVIALQKFGLADKPDERESYPQQEQIQDNNLENIETQ